MKKTYMMPETEIVGMRAGGLMILTESESRATGVIDDSDNEYFGWGGAQDNGSGGDAKDIVIHDLWDE